MRDTTHSADAVQTGVHRRLTGADKLALAIEMSVTARELALARLRKQHPDWPESECRRELLRYAFSSGTVPPPLR